MITTETIKELRAKTGISIMQCKKALEEAGGDMEKAISILKELGAVGALKKGDRTLGAGLIASYIHSNGKLGTILELACETDFVSGNGEFKQLAHDLAMHITASNPDNLETLLEQPFIKDSTIKIRDLVNNAVQKFGEKTEIIRFSRFGLLEQ